MKCNLCGSQDEQFPLLSGKPPHEKECKSCGAELCPKCGHRRSAHRPYEYDCSRQLGENYLDEKRRKGREYNWVFNKGNALQYSCEIMTSWTTNCNCKYYSYDLDEKFENDFNLVALGDLL